MHVIVAVIAAFGILWALTIWIAGGFTIVLGGLALHSHDPLRPLAVGLAAAAIYVITRGPLNFRRLTTPLAVLLALCPAAAGIARNSWTAGGADQYAYVSQADLWLQGDLTVEVPLAAEAPWPEALTTFMPHGFRPAVSGPALVPVTAPGLPLLMAAAKRMAGHCAMFLVTPLSGALLVWITFAVGRRLESDVPGLAAAWLVATSPTVLAMLMSPMSDVPAAACWSVAIYFTLGTSKRSALAAGLAASIAILIRPNLAPLAAALVLWKVWTRLRGNAATARQACLAEAAKGRGRVADFTCRSRRGGFSDFSSPRGRRSASARRLCSCSWLRGAPPGVAPWSARSQQASARTTCTTHRLTARFHRVKAITAT